MNDDASVPAVPGAQIDRLPATYEAARNAIATCERVDECKTWSDKAAALAAYARQAQDDSLRVMAVRIQARAVRRMGELIKQQPTAQGARTDLGRAPTRSGIAEAAGISAHQRKTALRVASVPDENFDDFVESSSPPTVTALAARGTATKSSVNQETGVTVPVPSSEVTEVSRAIQEISQFCARVDPIQLAAQFGSGDVPSMRLGIQQIQSWLNQFQRSLPQ